MLRGYIFDAVMSRVDWEFWSHGQSQELLDDLGLPDAPRTVSIEASRGNERASRHGPPPFAVARDEAGVRLLRALFLVNQHHDWNFEGAVDGLLYAPEVVDAWVQLVRGAAGSLRRSRLRTGCCPAPTRARNFRTSTRPRGAVTDSGRSRPRMRSRGNARRDPRHGSFKRLEEAHASSKRQPW